MIVILTQDTAGWGGGIEKGRRQGKQNYNVLEPNTIWNVIKVKVALGKPYIHKKKSKVVKQKQICNMIVERKKGELKVMLN